MRERERERQRERDLIIAFDQGDLERAVLLAKKFKLDNPPPDGTVRSSFLSCECRAQS